MLVNVYQVMGKPCLPRKGGSVPVLENGKSGATLRSPRASKRNIARPAVGITNAKHAAEYRARGIT